MTAVTSQKAIADFRESEIGKLFQRYEAALGNAWITDQTEHASHARLTKAWAKADAARYAFMDEVCVLAGVENPFTNPDA